MRLPGVTGAIWASFIIAAPEPSGARPVLDTCTPLDTVSLLGAQPTQDGWRTSASTEQDLDLDDNAVSSSLRNACIGVKGNNSGRTCGTA
ncbi:unnamed protein product [Pylaiella littoralis]